MTVRRFPTGAYAGIVRSGYVPSLARVVDRIRSFDRVLVFASRNGRLRGMLLKDEKRRRTRTSSLRILIVAPQPFYQNRGTPIVLRRVIYALIQCGHVVDMITFPGGARVAIDGLRIIRVGMLSGIRDIPIGFSIKKVILDLLLLPAIIRQLRRERYDCIHAVEEGAFFALIAARLYRVPLLYDMQSSIPEQLITRRLFRFGPIQTGLRFAERWLVRRVDAVACSVGLKEHVQAISPRTPVTEWRYPANDAASPPISSDPLEIDPEIAVGRYVIAYTGNFAPYQGVARLVEAIPDVLAEIPHALFLFVGAGNHEVLPGLSSVRSFADAVHVVPRRPQVEIAQYLEIADVVVSPREISSNLPLKVIEYISAGKPIVATDIPAHRKVLSDDSAILVCADPKALAAAIIRLYKEPDLGRRLVAASRQFALEHLGWSAFIDDVGKLYASLVRRGSHT